MLHNVAKKKENRMATKTLSIASTAPNFNLLATDGNRYNIRSFKNKELLMVVFGCNHCPYVIANEERIIEIQNNYVEQLQVIEINSNDSVKYPDDSYDKMVERAMERKYPFPYLHDKDQSVAKAFGATHTPEIFLFDKEHRLVYHGKLDDNWQDSSAVKTKYLRNAIDDTLAGTDVSVPETFSIGCTIKWK